MAMGMNRSIQPLVVGKVIGDVVDMFSPDTDLSIHYGPKRVANGCTIKPSAASERPLVRIRSAVGLSSNLYTLVMVDPDAPSPSEPTLREWLHWIVLDIPEGSDVTQGKEMVQYMGPQPPTGIHRYVFAVFKQKGRATEGMGMRIAEVGSRGQFSTRQFASDNGLGIPVAALYFNSQKEPATRKR